MADAYEKKLIYWKKRAKARFEAYKKNPNCTGRTDYHLNWGHGFYTGYKDALKHYQHFIKRKKCNCEGCKIFEKHLKERTKRAIQIFRAYNKRKDKDKIVLESLRRYFQAHLEILISYEWDKKTEAERKYSNKRIIRAGGKEDR